MTTLRNAMCCATMLLLFAGVARGGTLDDIKYNVKSNYNALGDITATVDITYTDYAPFGDETWDSDWTDANCSSAPGYKIRMEGTGADTRLVFCDGTKAAASADGANPFIGQDYTVSVEDRMYDFVWLIDNNTWSLAEGTYTVNGVECYKITSPDYHMWVDTSTKTKTMKVEYVGGSSEYVTFSGYSYLEGRAYMYDTGTYYPSGGGSQLMELSTIDIDASLPSTVFTEP